MSVNVIISNLNLNHSDNVCCGVTGREHESEVPSNEMKRGSGVLDLLARYANVDAMRQWILLISLSTVIS